MVIALSAIAVLILASVLFLKKFMADMAVVEETIIGELREIKAILVKINEGGKM
jgi:hypothetical protein